MKTTKNDPRYVKDDTVEIVAILDRSGSMSTIIDDSIGGFNTFLKQQQSLEGKAKLSLVLFDDKLEYPVTDTDIQSVRPLTKETYVPRGMTALNDAIGTTLQKLLERNPARAVIVILTDGFENASKTFTQHTVTALIKECEAKEWPVVYLAANQDAFKVAGSYGILASNTMNFAANAEGTRSAYKGLMATATNYRAGDSTNLLDTSRINDQGSGNT